MLGFPLGILSAAGAAVGFESDYELISSTILGTAAASVTFSSLGDYSSTYKHLQLRYTARNTDTDTGTGADFRIQLNGNTGSVYANHLLNASGSGSVASSAATSATSMRLSFTIRDGRTANAYSAGVLDILDPYSTSKNTTLRLLDGYADTSIGFITLSSGLFNSTASLTSIRIFPDAFNMKIGSRFSLYGIKG
jgi:hypothetical protein